MQKIITLFIGLVICAVAQLYLVSLDLVFLWLVGWAFLRDEREALYACLVGGILVSLFSFSPVGLVSLVYLLSLAMLLMTRRTKFIRELTIATFVYTSIILFAQHVLFDSMQAKILVVHVHLVRILFDLLIFSIIILFYAIFIRPKEQEPLRLKQSTSLR